MEILVGGVKFVKPSFPIVNLIFILILIILIINKKKYINNNKKKIIYYLLIKIGKSDSC